MYKNSVTLARVYFFSFFSFFPSSVRVSYQFRKNVNKLIVFLVARMSVCNIVVKKKKKTTPFLNQLAPIRRDMAKEKNGLRILFVCLRIGRMSVDGKKENNC